MLAVAGVAVAGTMVTGAVSVVGLSQLQTSRNTEVAEVLPYSTNLNAAALTAKSAANDERGYLDKIAECRSRLSRLTVVDVGDAGHFLPEERPREIAATLSWWLADLAV